MRRALRGAVGVLLAVVAVVPMLWASGKLPAFQRRGQQPPPQQVVHEESFVLTERHYRLEEIKVELALLADRATFPYHLGARAAGETLELHGFVPNEQARQYAMTLASHSTFLRVCNKVQIQAALGVTSPRRPAPMLQEEAAELMEKNLGEPAQAMSIGVRPNGLIVVAGSIASAEKKLAVSRLFRKLSGCQGVVNELIVPPSPRDGPSVVQTTLKGSILQPPALLNAKPPARIAAPVNPKRAIPASPLPVPPAPLQPVAPARPLAVTVPAKTAAPVAPKRAIPAPLLPVPPAPLQPVAPARPLPVAVPAKAANTSRNVLLTLPVKILVDQAEPTVQTVWEKRLRQRVEETSDILEQHCGVRLRIIEVGTWESDPKQTKLSELLQDFHQRVTPGKARLVIGFTGLRRQGERSGLRLFLGSVVYAYSHPRMETAHRAGTAGSASA